MIQRIIAIFMTFIFTLILIPYLKVSAVADAISILSITPEAFESYDNQVTFQVTINYTLQSIDNGVIYLGFNTSTVDRFNLVDDYALVSKGSGTITLNGTVKPVGWGTPDSPNGPMRGGLEAINGDSFKAYVNISSYPHPDSWDPLAAAVKVLAKGVPSAESTESSIEESNDLVDSDNDGLPDNWEKYGADTDNDGSIDLPLDKMGADPNKKDIFVEIDWMKSNDFFWWFTQKKFAPSEDQIQMVYNIFQKHDINLHIDSGPDSYNYINGEKIKWGDLAKGNSIFYSEIFKVDQSSPFKEDMAGAILNNFEKARQKVFRYAVFVDNYYKKDKDGQWKMSGSGTSFPEFLNSEPFNVSQLNKSTPFFGDGGQYFIVADGWHKSNGWNTDSSIAGTFMHELGHTLGLGHGGCDADNYKPNYLSIMNYSFQLNGLVINGDKVNYSNYTLPALDENNLNENLGVDPNGITEGSGLGTIFEDGETDNICYLQYIISSVSRVPIDFDRNGSITNSVRVEINKGVDFSKGEFERMLYSFNDWNNLVFSFQGMGINGNNSEVAAGAYFPLDEITLEEAIENSPAGTGSVSYDGYKLIANEANQMLYFKVNNLSNKVANFKLSLKANSLINDFRRDVSISASLNSVNYVTVSVPIISNPLSGTYSIISTLSFPGREDVVQEIFVDVYKPSEKEIAELKMALENSSQVIPEYIASQYKNVIDNRIESKEPISKALEPNLPVQKKGIINISTIVLIGVVVFVLFDITAAIIIYRKKRNSQLNNIDKV